jgi:hypothetical protein
MQARDTRVTVQLLPDEVVRRWWWHRHSPGPPTIHAMGAWGLVYWVPADSERMNWRFLFLGSDSQAGIHRRSDGRQHARTGMLARHTDTDGYGGGTMHPGSRTTWSAAPPAPRATERSTSTCRRVTWIARGVHGGSGSACACRAQHLALAFSLFSCHARLLVRACFLTRTV